MTIIKVTKLVLKYIFVNNSLNEQLLSKLLNLYGTIWRIEITNTSKSTPLW
jgi:hypothetical protein